LSETVLKLSRSLITVTLREPHTGHATGIGESSTCQIQGRSGPDAPNFLWHQFCVNRLVGSSEALLRVKVLRIPPYDELDGIDLRRFVPGHKYEVGNVIGEVMLAEGWAEPLPDDEPAWPAPFSDADPFMSRVVDRNSPPTLTREAYPPRVDAMANAADHKQRKRTPRGKH
jgi:hypothetical protein